MLTARPGTFTTVLAKQVRPLPRGRRIFALNRPVALKVRCLDFPEPVLRFTQPMFTTAPRRTPGAVRALTRATVSDLRISPESETSAGQR